jgi:hypothetical protein
MGDGLVWGIYSLIQQDTAIMVFACFQLTTSGLIVALKLVHTAKHAKQGLDPEGQNWKWPECFAHLEWRRS